MLQINKNILIYKFQRSLVLGCLFENFFFFQLQAAFASGLLKPGLNVVAEVKKKAPIVDKKKMEETLIELKVFLPWVSLDFLVLGLLQFDTALRSYTGFFFLVKAKLAKRLNKTNENNHLFFLHVVLIIDNCFIYRDVFLMAKSILGGFYH